MVAIAMSIAVGGAVAAVPTFPDNLVVFPNRDFISAEGFSAHAGETALVTVTRPGTGVVGSTEVLLGLGDVPFEVNHPGGFCWGNNTALQVTPDIVPGDEVSVEFIDGTTADVTTQDAFVTGVNYVDGATTFTVVGHIGAVVQANTEQRIVNPDLTDTAVGRRDIRAVPGPLAPDRNNSYESSLEFVGDTFTATYVFTDAAVAGIAATGGGERLLSWQNTDVDGNRQGITIAEFGELGGPGMGGCPNGPLVNGPRGPSNVTASNVAGGIRVDWTPAVAIPGTPAITGYRVHAVAQGVTGGNEQVEIGRRISGQADTGTTITGLQSGETYDVYVVSVSSSGETFPAIHAIPVTDVTPPTVSANPAGGTFAAAQNVTLTANELNAQIYYTLDGSPVLDAPDQPAAGALTYTGPINIAATTTLRAVAFDPSGNVSPVIEEIYTIDAAATVSASAGPDQEVSINAPVTLDGTGSTGPVTTYAWSQTSGTSVTLTGDDTATPTFTAPAAPATLSFALIVTGTGGPSTDSVEVSVVNPAAPVANAGPDQTVTRGLSATTVTLTGAGSTPGATYLWEQIGSPSPDTATLTGAETLSPSFTLPLYAFPATNAPRTFRLTVTNAALITATDTVTVTPVPGDSITVTKARFKNGDFRVDGTGTIDNAVVTIHSGSLLGRAEGTATVTAGVWTLRLRNGEPATNPGTISVESTLGSTVEQIAVN